MSQINNTIDINLYDRQIRTYGVDAVIKMSSSSVLVIGLAGGIATEVCKNLALGGVKNIYLYSNSDDVVTENDLETGYYYTNSIGYNRGCILATKLQELNPYVSINVVKDINQNQNVTIMINQDINYIKSISKITRENNSKFIAVFSKGVSGCIFVDAGFNHLITDKIGENIEPVQIGEITPSGKVICAPNTTHDYQSGDVITFDNLQGHNVDQFKREFKIDVINKRSFQLKDFDIIDFHFINGSTIYLKQTMTIDHQPFEEQINDKSINFTFIDNADKIIDTYLQMFSNNLLSHMPFIWSEDNKHFMDYNKIILPEIARTFDYELMPIVSFFGSIVASETIKLVTNKYVPINQWFVWSDNSLIPTEEPDYKDTTTSYGYLYGKEFETKLMNSSWLMVGSGAIGCEHLKNLAFMNVKNVIITDPDFIEKSNLNRQFLFRSNHIGKPKSVIASSVITEMKPDMEIISHLEKVGNDNIAFTNKILNSGITGVLNALDNIKARRFMDEECFKFNLPLFESGTTGTKGNTQAVIPFITETYSASNDPEQEKSFPICTIKSFPNQIEHTIHWAMDQFEMFNRAPNNINKWLSDEKYLDSLAPVEKAIAMEDIHNYTVKYSTYQNIYECARWAIDMFIDNYYNNIVQLLHTFKPDHEVAPGVLFWSTGKRCPIPIIFDINNKQHMDYIEATTRLLSYSCGIKDNFTREDIYNMIKDYKPKEFILDEKKTIAINDSDIKNEVDVRELTLGDKSHISNCYIPIEFEKDDETNWHIEWINIASNMRAINYGINPVDKQETKGIAGRIIPAIATTTSAVSGLVLIEMLKYLKGYNKVENYRSTFINLVDTTLVYSDPIEAPLITVGTTKINSWTKMTYKENNTLGEFKEYYEKLFQTSITTIVIGTIMIYAEFLGDDVLSKNINDIIKENLDEIPDIIIFSLLSNDDDLDIPAIQYIY